MDTKQTSVDTKNFVTERTQKISTIPKLAVIPDLGTVDALLARMSNPPTIVDRPSQIIPPLLDGEPSLDGPKSIVSTSEKRIVRTADELLTGIFCRGNLIDDTNLFRLVGKGDIINDKAKLDIAISIVKDLLQSVSIKKPETRAEKDLLTQQTIDSFRKLGVQDTQNFRLEGINVIFNHDSLIKFIKDENVVKAFYGEEQRLSKLVLDLLEFNRPNAQPNEKQRLETEIKNLLQAQAKSKKIKLEFDSVANLLDLNYVVELIDVLSIKNFSDSLFKSVDESKRRMSLIQAVAARKAPRSLVAGLRNYFNPGKSESDIYAKICKVMYEEHNAGNLALGFNSKRIDEQTLTERAKENTKKLFASIGMPLNDMQHNRISKVLYPNDLASLISNNLIEDNALMISPKTIMYLFLSLNMKRIGAFSKNERHDYAQSLANDLEKRGVDKQLIKSLRAVFGDAKFADFVTLQISDYIRVAEIFNISNDDFNSGDILKNESIQAYIDQMSDIGGDDARESDVKKVKRILTALGKAVQRDQSILNNRRGEGIKDLPEIQDLLKPVLDADGEPLPSYDFAYLKPLTDKDLEQHLYRTFSNMQMALIPTRNLLSFLTKTFPYADKSIPELIKDVSARMERVDLIERVTEAFLKEVQGVVNDESFNTQFLTDTLKIQTKGNFFQMSAVGLNHLARDIASEIIAVYDGDKPIDDLSLNEIAPEPIKFSEKLSKKNFGQSLYLTTMKHMPLSAAEKERVEDILYSRSGKSRFSRRALLRGAAVTAGITAVGGVGLTTWVLNQPKPFYEKQSFTLRDLEIAAQNGDLQHEEAKPFAVFKDIIDELMQDSYALQRGDDLSVPRISKKDLVFSVLPMNNTGAFVHYKTGVHSYRERDSEEFIGKIKESFEDTIFKNLNLSPKEKENFAKRAMDRYHDLLDNYYKNPTVMSGKGIPAALHPILMENPDPKKTNLIPIVFADITYAKSIALGANTVELYRTINQSLRSFEKNLQVSYNSYKVDEKKKYDPNIANDPAVESRLKIILIHSDRSYIFGSLPSLSTFNKVKSVLAKYAKETKPLEDESGSDSRGSEPLNNDSASVLRENLILIAKNDVPEDNFSRVAA